MFLLQELVKRDFQARYAGSILGFLWPFFLPLWQLLLFSFVFQTVMRVPIIGERTDNFAFFLFCGLLPWMAIHEGIVRSATAITDNANLVKSVHFKPELLVLSVVLSGLLHQGLATGMFLLAVGVTGEFTWQGLPYLLLVLPLQILLTTGLGMVVASLHTLFRDTAQVLSVLLTGWFYFTPIVYPMHMVPEDFQPWIAWNPLTTVVALYRRAFLGGDGVLELAATSRLLVLAGLTFALGLWFFRRLSRTFVDEV